MNKKLIRFEIADKFGSPLDVILLLCILTKGKWVRRKLVVLKLSLITVCPLSLITMILVTMSSAAITI